ncbi:hypothetical protein C8A05DRAFT_17168 [Staphylotrichum tortipilum]|uniref:CFEM domain-containing protein n=1 Tax=Staphylotrichum tortipilum TaxID=2831512 RepID=A0AAN6MI23_9PEZI|nr:hypothetical protein C8A05DRAFT_17168 [Staphylotrichum longicolle]
MKTLALILAATSGSLAQNLAGQPDCATACIISAVSAAGCAPADIGCQCGPSQSAIGASAAPCLLASCSISALLQAQSAGEAECASYSATATAPAAPANPTQGDSGPASGRRGDRLVVSTVTVTAPASSSTGGASSSVATAGAAAVTPAVVKAGALLCVLGAAAAM